MSGVFIVDLETEFAEFFLGYIPIIFRGTH